MGLGGLAEGGRALSAPVDVNVDVGVTQCACGGRVLERATSQPRGTFFCGSAVPKVPTGGCCFFLFPLMFSG